MPTLWVFSQQTPLTTSGGHLMSLVQLIANSLSLALTAYFPVDQGVLLIRADSRGLPD